MRDTQQNSGPIVAKGAALFETVETIAAVLFMRPRLDQVKREPAQ